MIDTIPEAIRRKQTPVFSGVVAYFPDALLDLARCSFVGNEQHSPGQPLQWVRDKSNDHLDAAQRHLIDSLKEEYDTDGVRHVTKAGWRILAALQLLIEAGQ